MIYSNTRIEIYGKKKFSKLLHNLLNKTRLKSAWFNKMVKSVTADAPIKIFLVEGTNYKNKLYGKATSANVILIFIDEMIVNMNDWWKELLLCVSVHEILHLSQSTEEYYQTWRYIPLAEQRMEQDADMMTWKTLDIVKTYISKNTSIRLSKFMDKVAQHILDIRIGEVWRSDSHEVPQLNNYFDSMMADIFDELDVEKGDFPKLFIQIRDEIYEVYNTSKNAYDYRVIEFFFYYTEYFRIKYGKEGRIKGKKYTYILEYDTDIYKLGQSLLK